MKNLKITLCLLILTITGIYAQELKTNTFLLSPEKVKLYEFETSTKGAHFEYEFEDDYTIKLTNKVYKINLYFKEGDREVVQKTVSKILDGKDTSKGFKTMVWKKTTQSGKPLYLVELKENKLRIEVVRKQMDAEAYKTLNSLGQEFIKKINS
ncbi:MAG: hypothetical protein AB8B59_05710 [Maribacter sp.]